MKSELKLNLKNSKIAKSLIMACAKVWASFHLWTLSASLIHYTGQSGGCSHVMKDTQNNNLVGIKCLDVCLSRVEQVTEDVSLSPHTSASSDFPSDRISPTPESSATPGTPWPYPWRTGSNTQHTTPVRGEVVPQSPLSPTTAIEIRACVQADG